MLATVQLDNQVRRLTAKVDDVAIDLHLTRNFQRTAPIAQTKPQALSASV